MRVLRFVSLVFTIFLLCCMMLSVFAEEDIISSPVDSEVGEVDSIDITGFYSDNEDNPEDIYAFAEPENDTLAILANTNGDFELDGDDILVHYGGIDKNVVIPDGIKEIRYCAFQNDELMESVIIPNSVTIIGWYAFNGCTNLKSVVIPNSVTSLDDWMGGNFGGCTNLQTVQISNNLTSLPGGTFANCSSLTNVTIPNSITTIGGGCFQDCDSLVSIVIPDSVTTIGDYAFGSCDNLESITIPASVQSIDRNAFKDSNKLVIRGTSGTFAERYAEVMGIPFNAPIVTIRKDLYMEDEKDKIEDHPYAYINQTYQLAAEQYPADLATTLKWSSSDASIATVDQNGIVKGVGPGTAVITAETIDGRGKAAQVDFIVPESTVIRFHDSWGDSLSEIDAMVKETAEIQVSVETQYSDKTGIEMPVTFTSSDDSIIKIKHSEKTADSEYKLTHKGYKPGKATITATTPDNGTQQLTITIKPRPIADCTITGIKDKVYTGAAIKPVPTVKYNGKKLVKDTDYTVSYKNNKKVGTATVTVKGMGIYGGTQKVSFTITPRAVSKCAVTGVEDMVYTGKAIKPLPTVKYGDKTLKKGTDYTLSYKNNKAVGKATVTINGKGNFTGTKQVTFRIAPKAVAISSLTAGKDSLEVQWEKSAGITGYQLQYSQVKDFSTAKSVTVTGVKSVSRVIRKLESGKTYYVRIRTYKTVNGAKYYSAWSATKAKKNK